MVKFISLRPLYIFLTRYNMAGDMLSSCNFLFFFLLTKKTWGSSRPKNKNNLYFLVFLICTFHYFSFTFRCYVFFPYIFISLLHSTHHAHELRFTGLFFLSFESAFCINYFILSFIHIALHIGCINLLLIYIQTSSFVFLNLYFPFISFIHSLSVILCCKFASLNWFQSSFASELIHSCIQPFIHSIILWLNLSCDLPIPGKIPTFQVGNHCVCRECWTKAGQRLVAGLERDNRGRDGLDCC